jgi:uncharacterized protein YndB with AHSA1/START domain
VADIFHDFVIRAIPEDVFEAVSSPRGLDRWWTKRSSGVSTEGSQYNLWFDPEHDWRAKVTRCVPGSEFELEIVRADRDWMGTRVGFQMTAVGEETHVRFHHLGWPEANRHYRISNYCWAMYLRLLKRYLEHDESVLYEQRLDA